MYGTRQFRMQSDRTKMNIRINKKPKKRDIPQLRTVAQSSTKNSHKFSVFSWDTVLGMGQMPTKT